jgi:ParB family chromosome partitioning protein
MATKKRAALGRGLDSLLPAETQHALNETPLEGESVRQIALDHLHRGKYQPRREFSEESLQELAQSIRSQGVIQPLIVRPAGRNQYEIIAGERRWRAAGVVGLETVPAIVRKISDQTAAALALIENIQRHDLSALEEAMAIEQLIEMHELTHQGAADMIGRSRAAVSNLLRLLELEPPVKKMLDARQLEMGHGRALLALSGTLQIRIAEKIIASHLSVRQAEALIRQTLAQQSMTPEPPAKPDPDITRLETQLSDRLGARVMFKHHQKGHGKLVIHYGSLDELDGIIEKIDRQDR